MLPIQFMPVKYNFNKGTNKPKYIVIHDTGNPTASAGNHFRYFNGGNRGASAHYFIDQDNIIQIIRDEDSSWHCGDGKGKHGITNSNSIGIEICLPGNRERSVAHAIDLTVELMQKHDIPLERVVRHYDASRKSCPNFMKPDNWSKWIEFKARAANQLKGGNGMNEQDIKKIVQDEVKKIVKEEIKNALKPSEIDKAGQESSHWAEGAFQNLQGQGIKFHERRYDDLITRGEVFQVASNLLDGQKCKCDK